MPKRSMPHEEYLERFCGPENIKAALKCAQENRAFEIELYWKRATYFWTFIGASFAGYFAVQPKSPDDNPDFAVFLACLGLVFSFAWYCVNRGSKKWQENWEKHVDMLEDSVTGPLYKTVLSRNDPRTPWECVSGIFTGPASLSVSKINQLISFYVFAVWVFLLWYSLPRFDRSADVNGTYVVAVAVSILACVSFLVFGRTYGGGHWHKATIRTSRVRPQGPYEK